jgi:hypothetical protein
MVITEGMRLPADHATITVTFQAQVASPLANGLMLGNTACTTSSNWIEILSPPCEDAAVQVQSSHALTVTKTATPSLVAMGSLLTYTIHYAIAGDEAVESMVVSDTTPLNTIFDSAAPTSTLTATLINAPRRGERGPVIWRVSGLWPPGTGVSQAVGTLQMVVRVNRSLISGTLIYNAVTISDTTALTDTDEITTPVRPPTPDLTLIKTVEPSHTVPDMPFTYTLRIVNSGDIPFTALRLTDNLPSTDFHYVPGSGVPTPMLPIAEPLLVWSDLVPSIGGPLAPGASTTVTFQVKTPLTDGTYTNTATVTGTYDPDRTLTATDEAPVSVAKPMVAVDKEIVGLDRNRPQNYVTFTVAVSNTGPSEIQVLPLKDQYDPYYLSLEDATPDPDAVDGNAGRLTWSDLTGARHGFGRNLPPGQSFVITTVFRIVHDLGPTTTTTNTAVVTGATDVYGNAADEVHDEVSFGKGVPTPVEVFYFHAAAEESAIWLEWGTAAEVNIAGFYVYRASVANWSHAQTITYLQATGSGSTYRYVDQDVAPGQVYWYWLGAVDAGSAEPEVYGPVWGGVGANLSPYRLYLPLIQKGW